MILASKKRSLYLGVMIFLINIVMSSNLQAQGIPLTNHSDSLLLHSDPAQLAPPPPNSPGYPSRAADLDVFPGFLNPPDGYGQVPFYWWVGEKLTKERLLWQLEKLHKAGTQGLNVSYAHSHPSSDPELNKNGYGRHGITYPSDPAFFSDEWWQLWDWFTGECAKRDMGVGLDDYTFSVPGNKRWPDEIAALPEMKSYQGKLAFNEPIIVRGGESRSFQISEHTISLTAFRKGKIDNRDEEPIDLLKLANDQLSVTWTAPKGGDWQVILVNTENSFMLHPQHGEKVIQRYFHKFEEHISDENRKAMNYFFQDELDVDLDIGTWAEDFADEFIKCKGYDIRPYLPALFHDIGNLTPKIRLDYMDVVMSLAETRYFRPIFEWHWKRGLIYGSDNKGRGKNPVAYGDYFRANSWYSAPGNDAARFETKLVQTKVSSSIAHLYDRPRVWFEAFHSTGWGTTPESFIKATDIHYNLGASLLCLHGLYYTTFGSWWEWAPPDFHFRMPYWPHLKNWFKYVERLSYLLSQGNHVCDVAVLYPTSSLQAYSENPEIRPDFSAAHALYAAGIDFDFIDYQSLARSKVKDGKLYIADETYSVVILDSMKAVRFSSLKKACDLFRSGGVVIGLETLPIASDRVGSDDPEIDAIEKEVFGLTASQISAGTMSEIQVSPTGGKGIFLSNADDVGKSIKTSIVEDFSTVADDGHVLHRRVGYRDVYMVMDVPKGTLCFFRSHGKVELWDAMTGEVEELSVTEVTSEGTVLRIPVAPPSSCLIVFTQGDPKIDDNVPSPAVSEQTEIIELKGKWECEIFPTMDNQWGDFRLPATTEMIGPEARQMRYATEEQAKDEWQERDFDGSDWQMVTCDFGPRMWHLVLSDTQDVDKFINTALVADEPFPALDVEGSQYSWKPYGFSWRWGVEDQPGSQGYHGLKGKVSDHFLIMGEGGHHLFGSYVHVSKNMTVRVLNEGEKPYGVWIDGEKLQTDTIPLIAGRHLVLACYKDIPQRKPDEGKHPIDERCRSALVFVQSGYKESERVPLSMKWYSKPEVLNYDYLGGKNVTGCYRFQAPPGLSNISFWAHGDVNMWIDGNKTALTKGREREDGAIKYSTNSFPASVAFSIVALRMEHKSGYYRGSAFPKEIALTCGKGRIESGDWSKMGVLEHYSGGMWYRKNVFLKPEQVKGKTVLELGRVYATCEIHVNGKKAGVLVTELYTFDISRYVRAGGNRLEILVYNTLANHYQTIPTPEIYKKVTPSGLLGPVKIIKYMTEDKKK
jgi:hypothetical protein